MFRSLAIRRYNRRVLMLGALYVILLLRMMMVRQSLIASGFALGIATVWGFLESFGMVGHVEAFYGAVLWFGGLGIGACINKLTGGRHEA